MTTDADALVNCIKICALCVLWYSMSAANGIIGKTVLSAFPYPLTITIVQLVSTCAWSYPLFLWLRVPHGSTKHNVKNPSDRSSIGSYGYYAYVIIPLAFGKFLASASGQISIWKVPVSYAHTVKATMPLFAVALSKCVLGEKYTMKTYASLVPIIVGVLIATMTELQFDVLGLLAALVSTGIFALQNVYSKKCLIETDMHQLRLLFVLAKFALVFALPCWFVFDVRHFIISWSNNEVIASTSDERLLADDSALTTTWLAALLALDGFCNFAQNCVAFTMIALISPLSYSVANCCKRVAVIGASLLVLRNPITWLNVLGMAITLLGVFAYNQAQLERKHASKHKHAAAIASNAESQLVGVTVDLHSHSFLEMGAAAKAENAMLNGIVTSSAQTNSHSHAKSNGSSDDSSRRFGSRVEHDVVNRRVLIYDV